MNRVIAVVALVLILGVVNSSIAKRERHINEGRVVLLELRPVDPRSLMQGDYMDLRFKLADAIEEALGAERSTHRDHQDGYVIVQLDEQQRGQFSRLSVDDTLADGEMRLRYRVRGGRIKLATNAFFFQEGHASIYEVARYGQFRVDKAGELLLTAMHDEQTKLISPDAMLDQPSIKREE